MNKSKRSQVVSGNGVGTYERLNAAFGRGEYSNAVMRALRLGISLEEYCKMKDSGTLTDDPVDEELAKPHRREVSVNIQFYATVVLEESECPAAEDDNGKLALATSAAAKAIAQGLIGDDRAYGPVLRALSKLDDWSLPIFTHLCVDAWPKTRDGKHSLLQIRMWPQEANRGRDEHILIYDYSAFKKRRPTKKRSSPRKSAKKKAKSVKTPSRTK